MPRRRVLTDTQVDSLLALPSDEPLLVRHWTLDGAEIAAAERRRGGHNQLGFALQLCAFRYPGRLLRLGDTIPEPALRFVAEQLRVGSDALASYAIRPQTRREQLDALREEFGFSMFAPGHSRALLAWLLPIAVAAALMDELRRRRIIAPGPSVVERLVAAALVVAERHVAGQLTRSLSAPQTNALDALLQPKDGTSMSVLAWARQPPGAPGHRALARIVEQLACLRAVGLNRGGAEAVHPERLRKLAREGGRFTAQHLRALSPLRRRVVRAAHGLSRAQQRLRRDARPIGTLATDQLVLDECDAQPAICERAGAVLARRASADHDDVVAAAHDGSSFPAMASSPLPPKRVTM
jgi:hypothetical protein